MTPGSTVARASSCGAGAWLGVQRKQRVRDRVRQARAAQAMTDQIHADHQVDLRQRHDGMADEMLRAHRGGQKVRRLLAIEGSEDHAAPARPPRRQLLGRVEHLDFIFRQRSASCTSGRCKSALKICQGASGRSCKHACSACRRRFSAPIQEPLGQAAAPGSETTSQGYPFCSIV